MVIKFYGAILSAVVALCYASSFTTALNITEPLTKENFSAQIHAPGKTVVVWFTERYNRKCDFCFTDETDVYEAESYFLDSKKYVTGRLYCDESAATRALCNKNHVTGTPMFKIYRPGAPEGEFFEFSHGVGMNNVAKLKHSLEYHHAKHGNLCSHDHQHLCTRAEREYLKRVEDAPTEERKEKLKKLRMLDKKKERTMAIKVLELESEFNDYFLKAHKNVDNIPGHRIYDLQMRYADVRSEYEKSRHKAKRHSMYIRSMRKKDGDL